MTSCAANWLTRTFRCLFDDSNRVSRVRELRFRRPGLESLEERDLLSDASGVWSFVTQADPSSDESERADSPARRVPQSDLRRAVRHKHPTRVNWLAKTAR